MPSPRRVFEVSVESSVGSTLAVIYFWENAEDRRGTEIKRKVVVASGIGGDIPGAFLNAARQWAGYHPQGESQASG